MKRLLLLLIIILGLGLPSASAKDSVNNLVFETTGQNLWGEGSASNLGASYDFVNLEWHYSEGFGYIISAWDIADELGLGSLIELFGLDDDLDNIGVGAEFYGGSDGVINARLSYGLDSGSVDVSLPVGVTLTFPDPNTFAASQDITIESSFDYGSGAYLNTTPPALEMFLGGKFGVKAGVGGKLCLGYCQNVGPLVEIPNNFGGTWEPLDLTIVSIKKDGKAEIGFPGGPSFTLPHTVTTFETLATGISGDIELPEVETTSDQMPDGLLIAEGEHTFIDLDVDLDFWLTKATKIPLGVTFTYDDIAEINIQALDVDFNIDFTEERNAEFEPTTMVSLGFGKSVEFTVKDQYGNEVPDTSPAEEVEIEAGHTVEMSFPDQTLPLEVEQGFSLENEFSHSTGHLYASGLTVTAGKFKVDVPGYEVFDEQCADFVLFEVCIPALAIPGVDVDLGPIYTETVDLPEINVTFFDDSWELAAFNEPEGEPFDLDPEDPGIKATVETSKVVNNGGGTRTVTYTILVENDGDVPLKNVQVFDTLAEIVSQGSASAYAVDLVQSCELTANEGFDGDGANNRLLLGADILDDGFDPNPPPVVDITSGIIVLKATVTPNPYPPDFVNKVLSEGYSYYVGTRVEGNSSSTVNLGPGVIEDVDDFALYADHKVMFKDTGFIRGHVGSNGSIEIQQGDSGIVAGDLRAIDVIDVHGQLVVDYVFTNEHVKEAGKGALNSTGGVKEDENQDPYELPYLEFTAGWEDVTVETDPGTPFTLEPGTYGELLVSEGSEIILKTGEYFFDSLHIELNATVFFDVDENMKITVNVVKVFEVLEGAKFEIAPECKGTTRDIHINIMDKGNINIRPYASLCGIFVAPDAKITFQEHSRLEGAVYARFISLEKDVRIEYHDDWYGELYKLIDLDCDQNPDYN